MKGGRSAKSQMLLGLRGVGKTVLLSEINRIAGRAGYRTIELEAQENRRLAEMLVIPLRSLLHRLSTLDNAKSMAIRALRDLQRFASTFTIKVGELEVGVAKPDISDQRSLETDLPELLSSLRKHPGPRRRQSQS